MWLRQSTASQEILLGRFVDSTDGDTEETGLTINNTDIKLFKHGATTLANKNSGGATHISNGLYYCVLDATDTNTAGLLEVHVHVTGALSVKREYIILPQDRYDALIPALFPLDVNVVGIQGVTQTGRDIGLSVLLSSGTGTGQVSLSSGTVTVGTNNDKTGYALSVAGVQAIWDALSSALTTVGSIGKRLVDYITGDIFGRLGAPAGASIAADLVVIDNFVDDLETRLTATRAGYLDQLEHVAAHLDDILADTDEIQKELVDGGRTDLLIDAIKAKTDNLPSDPADQSLVIAATDAVMSRLGAPAGASVSADIAAAKADTAAIKLKTDNLPADPASNTQVNTRLAAASYVAPPSAADIDTQLSGTHGANSWEGYTPAQIRVEMETTDILATVPDIPTVDEIDDKLTAMHGAGSWKDLGGLVGSYTITLTIVDSVTHVPLSDVFVSLWNSALTVALEAKYSDVNGQVIFAGNAATYKVVCRKTGYSFTIPETVVVVDHHTQTIEGVTLVVTPPVSASTCRVYEYLFLHDDITPVSSVYSTAEIVELPYDYNGKLHTGTRITPVYNSSTGLIYWDIVYGAKVRITIPDFLPAKTVVVPAETTHRLSDL